LAEWAAESRSIDVSLRNGICRAVPGVQGSRGPQIVQTSSMVSVARSIKPNTPDASQVARWAVVSAVASPVLLIGGWAIAEVRQPPGYNPIRDTISALAASGASDRWLMTSALAGLGVCHMVTALGLRPARDAGRAVLACGGAATVLVATFPQPAHGNSVAHTIAATIAFIALGGWPIFAARRRPCAPLLTRTASTIATVGLLSLVVWFAAEIHGGERGLAERAAASAQALWPLAVVLTTRQWVPRFSVGTGTTG
jgi:hypothetical membrane protein